MSTPGPWDARSERGVRTELSNTSAAGLVLQHTRSAWLTYEPFYGLHEQPFSITSNPAFFYQSRSHASTFQDLLAGIRRRERLSVLTGDIGTGKTTLCRAVLQNLDRETFSAFVPDPFASREDLLKVLLMEFGVMSLDDLTSGRLKTASRTELSYLLYDFLGKLAPLQAFAVVIIDEAQNLSLPLLEEIRILSDADGRDRQLQVVLVGQLELRQKLKLAEMRQVDQRVSVRCHLEPMSGDGVAGYIAHRLGVAGGTPDRVSFSPEASELVYLASNGVPRLINLICDRALQRGYQSRAGVINREIVAAAVRELGDSVPGIAPDSRPTASPLITSTPIEQPLHAAAASGQLPDWLETASGVEEKPAVEAAPQPARPPRPPTSAVKMSGSVSFPRTAPAHERPAQPIMHMQQLTAGSLWLAGVVILAGLALGAVRLGVSALETVAAADTAVTPPPMLPAHPARVTTVPFTTPARPETLLPQTSSRNFVVEVALLETSQGAKWLTADLAKAGYRAYAMELDLASQDRQHLVAIGPYGSRAEAELDLHRLHQTRGYEHARLTR
jgi:general secretion pathway protein A